MERISGLPRRLEFLQAFFGFRSEDETFASEQTRHLRLVESLAWNRAESKMHAGCCHLKKSSRDNFHILLLVATCFCSRRRAGPTWSNSSTQPYQVMPQRVFLSHCCLFPKIAMQMDRLRPPTLPRLTLHPPLPKLAIPPSVQAEKGGLRRRKKKRLPVAFQGSAAPARMRSVSQRGVGGVPGVLPPGTKQPKGFFFPSLFLFFLFCLKGVGRR